MRRHLSGTLPALLITSSTEAKMSQFRFGSEPLWARVCSVFNCQDSIKELFKCILRVIGRKTAARCGAAASHRSYLEMRFGLF